VGFCGNLLAQVFMGDAGLVGYPAASSPCVLIVRKELLIPVLCGVFSD
jgi:hypothetical protein